MSEHPVLQVENLGKRYGGVTAVNGVNFSLNAHELMCIIGPNGAGKSSLVTMLSGVSRPSVGDIKVRGRSMTGCGPAAFCRRGVVQKFQGTNTFQWLSVRDNLVVAELGVARWRSSRPDHLENILELIGLSRQADTLAAMLPHGQRQWLELGMSLMSDPDVLLLDEPTAGMTPDETRKVSTIIDMVRQRTAVVVIEHDMAFVRSLRCRTLVLHQGKVIREGRYEDIEQDQEIRDIYLGREVRGV